MLQNNTFLITGIADKHSLAMYVAKEVIKQGGKVICTGLGVSEFHKDLSEKAQGFLNKNFNDFKLAIKQELGDARVEILDVTLEANMKSLAKKLKDDNVKIHGFLHAIAMDKTIRHKEVKPLLQVTKEEFCDTMDVSAYSLKSLSMACVPLFKESASIVGLDFDATVAWPKYDWMGVAKAALESTSRYLARDLGPKNIRVNLIAAGPIRTMAAKSIPGFQKFEDV